MRRRATTLLGAAVLAAIALAFGGGGSGSSVHAQELTPELEERQLGIERQLLCPQCTNKRLDVCELAICIDMRQQIQEQLIQGRTNDEIIFFFSNRYGQRVLAEIPREGFNLVLFGWVGGSMLLVALGGGLFLWNLRRSGRAYRGSVAATGQAPVGSAEDDAWLEAELSEEQR